MKEKKKEIKMAMKEKMTVAEISEFFGISEAVVLNWWEKQKNGIKRIEGETPIAFKTDDVFSYAQEEQIIQPNVLTRKSPKSVSYKATAKIDESCPLCGKYDPVIDLGDDGLFRVVCQSCHHQGVGMPSADEAIREWNKSARYYRNVSTGKTKIDEIKKIMQCEKCGYTCLEEVCEVKRFGEYTQDGWIEWDDLVCPRCGEPIWETNPIRQITEVVNEKKNKGGKMSSKIKRTGLDAYIKSEPIEKALYATGAFTKYQCLLLAKGIIQYLEEFGVKEI